MKRGSFDLFQAIVLAIIIIVILVVVFVFMKNPSINNDECNSDSDCVTQQLSCCPCSSGGQDACLSKENSSVIQSQIQNCSKDTFCAQVYNCKIKSCVCENGKCLGK